VDNAVNREQYTVLFALLGLGVGAGIVIGVHADAFAAAGIAVLPFAIFAFPAGFAQAMGRLASLAKGLNHSFVAWVLLFLSGLVFRTRATTAIEETPVDGWAVFRIGLVALAFLVVFSRFLRDAGSVFSLARGIPAVLLGLGVLGAISTAWSVFPAWTLYKSLEFVVDVAVLASIIYSMKGVEQCKRFFDWTWALLFVLLLSVWAGALIWPEEALERGVGLIGVQLSGVIPAVAANGVGEAAALLGVVSLVRLIYTPCKTCYTAVFACCCATMILAQTRSALAGFAGGCLAILVGRRRFLPVLLIVAALALVFSSSIADPFWNYIRRGQDEDLFTSFSGRTSWWTVALEKIEQRPVLGYGAYSGGRFVVLEQLGSTETSSVHNDYLEVLLGSGVIGLALVTIILGRVWRQVLRASGRAAQTTLEQHVAVEALATLTVLTIRSMFSTALFWHPPLQFFVVAGYTEVLRRAGRRRVPARDAPVWAARQPLAQTPAT
jgi:O-antigen ligase